MCACHSTRGQEEEEERCQTATSVSQSSPAAMKSQLPPPRETRARRPPDSSQGSQRRSGLAPQQPKARPRGKHRTKNGDSSRSAGEAVSKASGRSAIASSSPIRKGQRTPKKQGSRMKEDGHPFEGTEPMAIAKPEPKRRTTTSKGIARTPTMTDEARRQREDERMLTTSAQHSVKNRRGSSARAIQEEHNTAGSLDVPEKEGEMAEAKDDRMKRPEPAERRKLPAAKNGTPRPWSHLAQDKVPGQSDSGKGSALRTPVPAKRRRFSSNQRSVVPALASAFAGPKDVYGRRDVQTGAVPTAPRSLMTDGDETFQESPGGNLTLQSCPLPRGDEPGKRAVVPRDGPPATQPVPSQEEVIMSKQDGLLVERSATPPAVPNDSELQPAPLSQCFIDSFGVEAGSASRSACPPELSRSNENKMKTAIVARTEKEIGITSMTERPYRLELSALSSSPITVSAGITQGLSSHATLVGAGSVAPGDNLKSPKRVTRTHPISLPSEVPKENVPSVTSLPAPCMMKPSERRRTIEPSSCATTLHLDEFVNDSLQGVRLALEGPTEKDSREQITAHNFANTDVANQGPSENAAHNVVTGTESKQMQRAEGVAGTIEQTTKIGNIEGQAGLADESMPVPRQEKSTGPTVNSKMAAPEESLEPERLQQVDKHSVELSGFRNGNEKVNATEERHTAGEARAKVLPTRDIDTNRESGVHLPGHKLSIANVLLMGQRAGNVSVLEDLNVDAPKDAQKSQETRTHDAERHTTKGDDPHQRADEQRPPTKAVKIVQGPSPVRIEEGPEATQPVNRHEDNAWIDDCRLACENLMSTVALVLVVVLLVHVARPMYSSKTDPPIGAQQSCYGQWCDRLGLLVLPNTSHQEIDPCGNFYQRVCYEWNVGHKNAGFVGSTIDSAYRYTRDMVYSSSMPPIVRNDLDHFVVFLRVCLEDSHFQAPLSEWMGLIRYELRHDFLVMPDWNWSRMVRAVIKKSLVDGLQTLVGLRVGLLEKTRKDPSLFLSVDGCLLSLLSSKASDIRAVASLLAEIIDHLPEFLHLTDAVAQVNRIALDIAQKRKNFVKGLLFCPNLATVARDIDSSTWVNEINRHVPENMRLVGDCVVHTYMRISPNILFSTLEEQSTEARALYINLLMVSQVLRFRYGLVVSALPKLHICMQASREAYRHLWVSLMMGVAHLRAQNIYLEILFQGIKQGIVADIEKRGGSNVSKLAVVALVNNTQLRPMSRADILKEDSYGGPELALGYRLPQYFLQTLAFQTKRSVRFLVDRETLMDYEEATSLQTVYHKSDLTISVPFFLLLRPVFIVYDKELYHSFATVGVLLAAELIKEANERSLPDRSATNKSAYCRIEQYLKTAGTGGDHPTRPSPTDVTTWDVAVNAAFRSLEKYVQRNMSPIEKLKYAKQLKQLFFERFCMLSCAFPPVPDISNMQRCLLPLMNMVEFAEAYGCRPGSNMVPRIKCGEM